MSEPTMKIWKPSKRRAVQTLAGLFLVVSFVLGQAPPPALALPPDPIDPGPVGTPPPYQAPAGGFDWRVPRRFGLDTDRNGLVDFHWNAETFSYSPSLIYPDAWPVLFYGCQTEADTNTGLSETYIYKWEINGEVFESPRCNLNYSPGFPDLGTYTVRLTVTDSDGNPVPAGKDPPYFEQQVTIKDYLIVSLGDSFASGEGNPDIPQLYTIRPAGQIGWDLVAPPVWQDERCHRSIYAGPAQAALALEAADPKTSVTFISFACSGATVDTPGYHGLSPDANKPVGTGILGPYRGAEPPHELPYDFELYIPSQMDQLRGALTPPAGKAARRMDALIISGGGNDIHFGEIAQACLLTWDCWENATLMDGPSYGPYYLPTLLRRAFGIAQDSPAHNLPANYNRLAAEIALLDPAPAKVYVTEYPDLTRNDDGSYCRMLDDIFWPNPLWAITPEESKRAAEEALAGLNLRLLEAAKRHGWQYVDGLSSYVVDPLEKPGTPGQFVRGPDGKGHGYCASDNWIRRADEAELIQGPLNLRMGTKGTLHPNVRGHQVYKERILRYLLPNLKVDPPGSQNPPAFSSSFSSGLSTSVAGDNGWFTESCAGATCSDMVVLQVVASSAGKLRGASVSVNGVEGCSLPGVSCQGNLASDQTQFTWDFKISAGGIYRLEFGALDDRGQTSSFRKELKVDLSDPVFVDLGPFDVDEGSSITLKALAQDEASSTLDYDWDLDNDGTFETLDEEPIFSAAGMDGPAVITVGMRVSDGAGRTARGAGTIRILNVAPVLSSVVVSPGTINEGDSVLLSGTIADPSPYDSFSLSIDWGDGSALEVVPLAAGTNSFSLSHLYVDDNPAGTASDTYTIGLELTDKDGAGTSASTSVVVSNVAPVLAITSPAQGELYAVNTPVSLAASISDPNPDDGHTCSVDWDTGTNTNGTITAGVCSASHAFSAAGVYTIQMTAADDDGGSDTQTVMVVVYDPSAGFVTGGGWIDSPAGAYLPDPSLVGRATFGFVARYQRGASRPVGQTDFHFQAGELKFSSSSYEWLVVSGARAQFRGAGLVNGVSGYTFLLTVTDGQVSGGGGTDKFRIKIWNSSGVVYDNVTGSSEDLDKADPQVIGGGSILIRSGR